MIDDMQGLFSHASDAYRAGMREGRDQFYRAAMLALSQISVREERAGNMERFHTAEDCCRSVREIKIAADVPQIERR